MSFARFPNAPVISEFGVFQLIHYTPLIGVKLETFSQESWPYYQKAIMESGTGSFWSYITLEAAHSNWQQVLQVTKCFGIPTKRWVAAVEWSEKHSKPIEELLDGLLPILYNQSQTTFFGILISLK